MIKLDETIIQVPIQRNDEDRAAWRRRLRTATEALQQHLSEVVPGKLYDSRDEIPNGLGWEVGVIMVTVGEKIFVPDFQLDDAGEFRSTVGAVSIHLSNTQLPWGSKLLWWVTDHPKLGCQPYTLLGTARNDEMRKAALSG
jgi:hypothetical protein